MANLILGLGGTGARVVESFLHLCAAGLGPARVAVAFIDQDQSNGNTLRARTTLAKYASAHRALRALGGEHPEPACDLLGTRLDPHPDETDVERCHWVPQRESDASLASLIKYSLMRQESAKGLARALFHDRDELRMPLNEGYRGRPHVGSAALLTQIETDEFWRSLEDVVRNANEEVRVFLCGSVFGGTGAAVLPTLARRLRQVAGEVDRPLRTAGALMLPYFTFLPAEDRQANVATGHELLLQSQSALRYYHEVGAKSYSFDDLYLVGWRPAIELSYHAPGAALQANPPLAPELFGALAGARFFLEERDAAERGDNGRRARLHVIARGAPGRLDWSDLPPVTDGKASDASYAAWLRFCALWHFNYARAFEADPPAGARDEAWFRTILGDADPDSVTVDAVGELNAYVSTALRYAAAMSAFSTWAGDGGASFNLWTHGPIAGVDRTQPTEEADLNGGALAGELGSFEQLIRGFDRSPDAAAVYWTISQKPAPASVGLWPLVAYLHACVDPTST